MKSILPTVGSLCVRVAVAACQRVIAVAAVVVRGRREN